MSYINKKIVLDYYSIKNNSFFLYFKFILLIFFFFKYTKNNYLKKMNKLYIYNLFINKSIKLR